MYNDSWDLLHNIFFFFFFSFLYPVMHFRLDTSVFQCITALILYL